MPTSTTANNCACCGLPNTLQCRVRGGSASLCGFSEFASPSSPPKKYLTDTFSGSDNNLDSYFDPSCANYNCTRSYVYANTNAYNSANCALTSEATVTVTSDGCQTPGTFPVSELTASALFGQTLSENATTRQVIAGTTCEPFLGTSVKQVGTSDATETLSNEDTEANAISRFQNATAFGNWIASGDPTYCTGTPPACCLAYYETRSSGFSFNYADAECRVVANGLAANTNYTAHVQLWRRPYGNGSYALFQTVDIPGSSDANGDFTSANANVTNTQGYETFANFATLALT